MADALMPPGDRIELCDLSELATDIKTYTLLSVDDLAALPAQHYRVKSVFPENGFVAFFGPPGSGKSFLAFDMAGAIVARDEWFGHRVRRGPAFYLFLEGEGGARNRIAAYRTEYGGASLANMRFILEPVNLLSTDVVGLIATINGAGMDRPTIFVDTLNRAAPGADENSSVDMGLIIESCKRLQAETDGLVVIVHHTGKDGTRGLRGHSSLLAALDAAIEVSSDGETRKWTLTKSKDGQDGLSHAFRLKVHELGFDEDGDPITSCTVELLDDIPDRDKKPKAPTGGNQKIVWDYLHDVLKDRPSIPTSELIEGVRGRLVCDEKRKPERIRQALTAMINAGLVTCYDDTLSFPVPIPVPVPPKGGNGKTGKWDSRNFPKTGISGSWYETEKDTDNEVAGGFDL